MTGLSTDEAERLKRQGLYNKAPKKTTKSFGKILFDNFLPILIL